MRELHVSMLSLAVVLDWLGTFEELPADVKSAYDCLEDSFQAAVRNASAFKRLTRCRTRPFRRRLEI